MKKATLSLVALCASFLFAFSAGAANNLVWTDLSNKLDIRHNRPVWAMAYGNGNWFYTDGQDLWNGGQVYRFDGATQTNITLVVRNAGLSRVDDIVSDGTSVLFLQDIVRLDNQVKAVIYRWGTYSNVTGILRTALDYNEGISSIVGRNGVWLAVTTRARFMRFNEDLSTFTRPVSPPEMKSLSSSDNSLLYSTNHRFDRGRDTYSYAGIVLAPAGNKFLVGVDDKFHTINYNSAYYLFDGQSFAKISNPISNNDNVYGMAFSQTHAMVLVDQVRAAGRGGYLFTFDGNSWEQKGMWFNVGGGPEFYSFLPSGNSNLVIKWNGSKWFVVTGKQMYQVTNGSMTLIGPVRDFFVTGASDEKGKILLGGAVGNEYSIGPTSPLTAKLTQVTEGSAASVNIVPASTGTTGNSYGLNNWHWLTPDISNLKKGEQAVFNVGAQSAKGLKRTDIYVNGALKSTCHWNGSKNNLTCSYTLRGNDYALGTAVSFNAKIADSWNRVVWTALRSVKIVDSTPELPSWSVKDNGTGIVTWTQLSPDILTLNASGAATYQVGAWDADSVNRIEIVVNGTVKKICETWNSKEKQSCEFILNGWEYPVGTQVAFNAKITDANGKYTWTALKTLAMPSVVTVYQPSPSIESGAPTAWAWTIPSQTGTKSTTATYHLGSWDADGIARLEIFVNGVKKQICNYNNSKENVTCSLEVYAWQYADGAKVIVEGKAVDSYGKISWAPSKSWTIAWDPIYASSWQYWMTLN